MGKHPRLRAHRLQIMPSDVLPSVAGDVIAVSPNPTDEPCEYAKAFTAFADAILATIATANRLVYINRAKLLLTDQYFRVRRTLPIQHQDTTTYDGHPCIYQAFVAAYERIERREVEVAPPSFETTTVRGRARRKIESEKGYTDPEMIAKMILNAENPNA